MIPIAKPLIGDEEINAVIEVLKSGMLASGKEVKEFEKEFAQYLGAKHGVAVVNGTAALDVALKALRIGPGDEVITTPFTFIASANSILFQGAKPVFADIDPKTYNLDPNEVLEKITDKTKAIVVVHLYGQPADMKAFKEIALGSTWGGVNPSILLIPSVKSLAFSILFLFHSSSFLSWALPIAAAMLVILRL